MDRVHETSGDQPNAQLPYKYRPACTASISSPRFRSGSVGESLTRFVPSRHRWQWQWQVGDYDGEKDGSPRPAVGRYRRGAPPGHRPRPPPQAGRAPRRRQDQRSGRRGCDIVRRPAVAGVGQRGDAGEGDAQHHDQAPRGVPGVAEERGQYAAGVALRVHAAHIAVRRRRWSLQKEIIFRCV